MAAPANDQEAVDLPAALGTVPFPPVEEDEKMTPVELLPDKPAPLLLLSIPEEEPATAVEEDSTIAVEEESTIAVEEESTIAVEEESTIPVEEED